MAESPLDYCPTEKSLPFNFLFCFSAFFIGSPEEKFVLHVGNFVGGTAGDKGRSGGAGDRGG